MDGCLACDLAEGRIDLPGGTIHETERWIVEHCLGPLGVGTLIVKPRRRVIRVSELDAGEAAEVGPLLQRVAAVVDELSDADQVYVALWSHAHRRPVHVHFVVQPVSRDLMRRFDSNGPALQAAMVDDGELPDREAVERFTAEARPRLAR